MESVAIFQAKTQGKYFSFELDPLTWTVLSEDLLVRRLQEKVSGAISASTAAAFFLF